MPWIVSRAVGEPLPKPTCNSELPCTSTPMGREGKTRKLVEVAVPIRVKRSVAIRLALGLLARPLPLSTATPVRKKLPSERTEPVMSTTRPVTVPPRSTTP